MDQVMNKRVYIGFDTREVDGYVVARHSIELSRRVRSPQHFSVHPVTLRHLRSDGLYHRPTSRDAQGRLFDDISEHPMSTEFAISRFFVPHLMRKFTSIANGRRWAIFMDSDVIVTTDLDDLFSYADPAYAVQVVKHDYQPEAGVKMDNQVQSRYFRKNWSSVILWNVDHPSNLKLDEQMLNTLPGRDLHRFCWLKDEEIGALPHRFNFLLGHDTLPDAETKLEDFRGIIHFTEGLPTMNANFNRGEVADFWWRMLHEAIDTL